MTGMILQKYCIGDRCAQSIGRRFQNARWKMPKGNQEGAEETNLAFLSFIVNHTTKLANSDTAHSF